MPGEVWGRCHFTATEDTSPPPKVQRVKPRPLPGFLKCTRAQPLAQTHTLNLPRTGHLNLTAGS